jgi:hypothetical protein
MSTKISAITVTQVKILGSLKAHREDEGTRACNSQKDLYTNCRDPLWKDANEEDDRDGEGGGVGTPEPQKHARPQALVFFPRGIRRLSGTVNNKPEKLRGRSDESHVVPVKPHE